MAKRQMPPDHLDTIRTNVHELYGHLQPSKRPAAERIMERIADAMKALRTDSPPEIPTDQKAKD